MSFVDLVNSSTTQPNVSFVEKCGGKPVACDLQKPNDHARQNTEKHLYSALHAVNLRILKLQSATFKSQKTGKHGQILSQLHDLTALEQADLVSFLRTLTGAPQPSSRITAPVLPP